MMGQYTHWKKLLAVGVLVFASQAQARVSQIPQPPVEELIPHGPVVLFGLFNLAMLVATFGYLAWAAWIGMMCGLGLPLASYLAYVLSGALTGARLWVMIAILTPVAIYGSEVITWPMWITLNGAQSVAVTTVIAVLSLAFTMSANYCMVEVYAKSRGARALSTEMTAQAPPRAAASLG